MIRHLRAFTLTVFAVTLASPQLIRAQVQQTGAAADPTKKRAMTIEDYARWRTIETSQLSGDGKWVAYVLRLTNVPQADSKPALPQIKQSACVSLRLSLLASHGNAKAMAKQVIE